MAEPEKPFVMPCLWREPASAPACSAPATHVLVNSSGEAIAESCEAHVEPSLASIRVRARALTMAEWKAELRKPRAPTLGGFTYEKGDAWEPEKTPGLGS